MADAPLTLCFGVHNHQPIGQFESVLAEATARAYQPFLERVRARPELRLTMHCSGSLIEWLRAWAPRVFDLLGEVAAAGQVELLTGGYYEPILAVLPEADQRGQVQRLTEFLAAAFGVRPRGMWLAERVWEPHLPRVLAAAGVEYVLLDDAHFGRVGLAPHVLGGVYVTEHQGARVRIVPISQRLRYLIPWKPVEDCRAYLESRRGEVSVLTVVDDGEKLGAWPGTHTLVYEEGWLDRFFDGVLATPWLRLATLGEAVAGTVPAGRVYLPTASYREMGEWALPVEAARGLAAARRTLAAVEGGAGVAEWLHGGFWRGFLTRYPEVGDTHWKMLGLSAAIEAASRRRRGRAAVTRARTALWRGQANDAYWHGVFGGCYLPHLRRAVKSSLLEAERELAAVDPVSPWSAAHVRLDAPHSVVALRTAADTAEVVLEPEDRPEGLIVEKRVSVRGNAVEAAYAVSSAGGGRWGVQWNLALTAGDAPGRYLRWPGPAPAAGWPSLGGAGRRLSTGEIDLVDEWIGVRARLTLDPPGEVAWGPVETVSASEAGVERIYQGTALLLSWPLAGGTARRLRTALTVEAL